jgi:hypothetical protein
MNPKQNHFGTMRLLALIGLLSVFGNASVAVDPPEIQCLWDQDLIDGPCITFNFDKKYNQISCNNPFLCALSANHPAMVRINNKLIYLKPVKNAKQKPNLRHFIWKNNKIKIDIECKMLNENNSDRNYYEYTGVMHLKIDNHKYEYKIGGISGD